MNPVIRKLHEAQLRKDLPEFRPGDTVRVNVRLQEGEGEKVKERLQAFEGVVISKKGRASSATFTVRRVSFGVGIERIFPLHSPTISSIEVVGKGKVRRARLYYLRELKGKAARIKRGYRGEGLSTASRIHAHSRKAPENRGFFILKGLRLGLDVGNALGAGLGDIFLVPSDGTVNGIDDVLDLTEAVALARIAHKNRFGSDVLESDEELLRFGDGHIVVIFAVENQRRRVSGVHILKRRALPREVHKSYLVQELAECHLFKLVVVGHVVVADQIDDARGRYRGFELIRLRDQPLR